MASCGDCFYYRRRRSYDGTWGEGWCRRNPPSVPYPLLVQLVPNSLEIQKRGDDEDLIFPRTVEDQYCAEHRQR